MDREEHIKELVAYVRGFSPCMCPESSQYWREHFKEIHIGLHLYDGMTNKAKADNEL